MNKAIFLDRDGVINHLIFNPKTNEYESPHEPTDLEIIPGVFEVLKTLNNKGFLLFIISNQPSYAKGKTTLTKIKEIHRRLQEKIEDYGINITEYYYCYHHPDGIIPDYTKVCECRKPKPFFIHKAEKEYDLDLKNSWLIGDQDTDIECGISGGVRTILLKNKHSEKKRGSSSPTYTIENLSETIKLIK